MGPGFIAATRYNTLELTLDSCFILCLKSISPDLLDIYLKVMLNTLIHPLHQQVPNRNYKAMRNDRDMDRSVHPLRHWN